MLNQKPYPKKVLLSICLFLTILILFGLFGSAGALVYVTYDASDYNVLNGTYVSGSVPASLQTADSDYFIVRSSPSATSASTYNPSTYNLFGSTAYVSGTTGDLVSDNDVHLVYRSYPSVTSAETLYAHQEATTVGGNLYYIQRTESADLTGTDLSASMAVTGRQLLGRFVYPLIGISSIPASTWTNFYRTWRDSNPSIAYDSVGSGNNGDGTANITWSHVVGSGTNRFMVIGISIRTEPVSVSSVTVGGQSATFLRSDGGTEVRGEVWYLINPDSGSKTVTVTLSATSKASGGSVSYTGVAQTSPIDNHRGDLYSGTSPSVSLTTTMDNDWIFSNLAISGTATVVTHGSGQVHRYYQIGTAGSGPSRPAAVDGDDKPTTTAGSYTISWSMSFYIDVVAQAVALKPALSPVGHVDVDISILKSDGTIRTTIATNVANSGDLTSTPATLSGTYFWAQYTVVNQTDYLEIDFYADVTSATSGMVAYLRIDDSALPIADQTRVTNVMLPNEYTAEVELTGASNTYSWTQLQWAVDSAWTTGTVTVTLQLYNYALSAYPTNGNGFVSYISNATANTDETKSQTITTSPQDFRDVAGNWKIKVKGVKTVDTPFDFKADCVEFRSTHYSEYTVATEFLFSSMTNQTPTRLNFTVVSEYSVTGVSATIQVWNYSSSAYANTGQGYLRYTASGINETQLLSIDINPQFYTSNGSGRIRITGILSTATQYQQRINQIKLQYNNAAGVLSPSSWLLPFLYMLPVPLAVFFLWFLGFKRKKRTKPWIENKKDSFSANFGMTHQQMVGKKMLLEIDPTSDYSIALSSFVSEVKNNGESLFIVTNKGSTLHSLFSESVNANFLLLTSKIHYSQRINERETLLPESDLSVLLDACIKIQKDQTNKITNVLFDNLSDVILRCGFEKTYKFTRLLLEASSSPKTTGLFVFIPTAHDHEISSSIRSLFRNQLAYAKDGPKIGKL